MEMERAPVRNSVDRTTTDTLDLPLPPQVAASKPPALDESPDIRLADTPTKSLGNRLMTLFSAGDGVK